MLKYLLFFIPIFFYIVSPAAANVQEWQQQQNKIQQQRTEIKEKMILEGISLELIKEENRLAAYQEAYQKAIEYVQQPDGIGQGNFIPVSMKPGETAPGEYIPIYKEAGERFGIDWRVLAAIHKTETNYSRIKIMVSSVGALGHMQFMEGTFKAYGIDGDQDGLKSPWSMKDSIFSAANYLNKSGYSKDIRGAIWHYNHAQWYVNKILKTAGEIKGI